MPLNPSDDAAVIQEVLSGRTEAFRTLMERYFGTVRLVALAKTGNLADAEDVAQETFIKAYETLGVLRDRERLAPWLVTIARNNAISLVRRRERERRNVEIHPAQPMIHPDHERRETLDAVARQVDALPENLREVVLLHYFEGLKCREIGERLDLNTNAVVKRLSRGREMLGDRLLREWAGDRQQIAPSVHRVMGAIAALPQPDWGAQVAAMGTAIEAGGVTAAIFGPPVTLKLIATISALALGAFYFSFTTSDHRGESMASSDPTIPVEEKSLVASAKSAASDLLERTLGEVEEESVEIEIAPPPPLTDVGFIAGRVFDQDGQPLQDVRLSARSYAASRLNGSATTNPNGDFRINLTTSEPKGLDKLRPLMIEVSCSMSGYGPAYHSVELNSSHVEFYLLRAAALEGTVIDARTRRLIEDFSWRISRPIGGDTWPGVGTRTYTTGWTEVRSKNGVFNVDDMHGIVAVSILADGYAGARVTVDLPLGSSMSGLVIPLEPGQQLTGTVFDKTTQRPLADVSVGIGADPTLAFFREHTKTDKEGRFSFRDMPTAVPITLTAKYRGMGSLTLAMSPDEYREPVAIFLGDGAQISGRVRYRGGPPIKISEGRYGVVYVRGATEGASEYGSGEIHPDGSYTVSGLSEGWYTVEAWFLKSDSGRQGQSISSLIEIREGRDVLFDIDGDEEAGGLQVAVNGLPKGEAARFELISMAAPGAVVASQVERGSSFSQAEEPDPVLHFPGIEPGIYELRATDPDTGTVLFEESISISEGRNEEIAIDLIAYQYDSGEMEAADGEEREP